MNLGLMCPTAALRIKFMMSMIMKNNEMSEERKMDFGSERERKRERE